MSLIKYSTNSLSSIFDNWDFSLSDLFNGFSSAYNPKVDVIESADKYTISMDLPGMLKNEIKISLENGNITVSGSKIKNSEKDEKIHYSERYRGSFLRSFSLPSNIDEKNVEAKYENGVLEINLNKLEKSKPKLVEIKVT